MPTRVPQLLTVVLPQVGFFPSECVELFTERPGPGLKAGKYHGEWAVPSPSAYHLSFQQLSTPQTLTVPCAASQLLRVSLL